jgi:hypothetical protein
VLGSIGPDEEARIGAQYAAEIRQQVRLIDDRRPRRRSTAWGARLPRGRTPRGAEYTFYLVDSPEVNAFAIPGGHIFVNRGLIEHADVRGELAGVLGHEIAHVTERHGLERVEKQQRANILSARVLGAGPAAGGAGAGGDPGRAGAAVFAKYGRDAEREADQRAWSPWPTPATTRRDRHLLRGAAARAAPGSHALRPVLRLAPAQHGRVRNARALIGGWGPSTASGVRDTPEYQRFRARVQALPKRRNPAR